MHIKSFGSEMKDYQNPMHNHNDEDIADLQSVVSKLDIVVNAMWDLLKENGIGEEKLHAKIQDILFNPEHKKRPSYEPVIIKCPRCGKSIQESRKNPLIGRCFYCGEQVVFYPYSEKSSAEDNVEEPGAESDGLI